MRIDRADLADGPGDAQVACSARPTRDDPDVADKASGKEVSCVASPDSPSASSDSALRTEWSAAYRVGVGAIYQQYAIDHGGARAEELERETATPAIRGIEAAGPERRLAGRADGVLFHGGDPPEGYTSSPALKGDPYHPDSVASRSMANRELYAATSRDRAEALGYTTRIPAQKAPFDSHGQEVFTNGKNYITSDVDGHNVSDGWKMFSRRGARIGTYDSELNYVKE
jgi:hypothetical protein